MSWTQPLGDLAGCRQEDRQVGLALTRQRSGEGDEDRIRVAELVVVGRRADLAGLDELG